MRRTSRRRFLGETVLAAAAGRIPRVRAAERPSRSPAERLRVAVVGVGGRGPAHARAFAARADCEVVSICDADRARGMRVAAEIAKRQERRPSFVLDMRRVFDDRSVDIVSTATPNHWHALCAIWAMRAGKDVYVEKPVSHNVSEGRRIVQAARACGRICQTGTQYRSDGALAVAVRYMRAGRLGEVKRARCLVYKRRRSIGPPGRYPVPAPVDYNLWTGPAPMRPVTRRRFHYDWHWFWDYGNGDLGNSGIHRLDVARWGMGIEGLGDGVMSFGGRLGYEDAGETPNTQVAIHRFGERTIITEVRGLATGPFRGWMNGVIFTGTEGIIAFTGKGTALFDPDGSRIRAFEGEGEDHFANFIRAVRSRRIEDLHADILEGHLSSALCHVGNVSHLLGRPAAPAEITERLGELGLADDGVETFERMRRHLAENGVDLAKTKLTLGPWLPIDPGKESFAGRPDANRLLSCRYREPFVVPAAEAFGKVHSGRA